MQIKELKQQIENKSNIPTFIIFRYKDSTFIPFQYINAISSINNLNIDYIEDISGFMKKGMFYVPPVNMQVYICDELKEIPKCNDNLFIITKKCPENDSVVDVPKLENWFIKDYIYSTCEGSDTNDLDYLFSACGKDIYAVDNEVSKIKLFDKKERKYLVKDLYKNHQLSRNNVETIFDFTNALMNKDYNKLITIYDNINQLDIEPLGVVTILYKNLKNMIMVGFQNNPDEYNTGGLTSKQIWGVKQSLKNQTGDRILKMFDIVSKIDFKLKNGELPADMILDYTVLKCLSA